MPADFPRSPYYLPHHSAYLSSEPSLLRPCVAAFLVPRGRAHRTEVCNRWLRHTTRMGSTTLTNTTIHARTLTKPNLPHTTINLIPHPKRNKQQSPHPSLVSLNPERTTYLAHPFHNTSSSSHPHNPPIVSTKYQNLAAKSHLNPNPTRVNHWHFKSEICKGGWTKVGRADPARESGVVGVDGLDGRVEDWLLMEIGNCFGGGGWRYEG